MKSLKFIILLFCLPAALQDQEIYQQIIHTNANVRLKEGPGRIHLLKNQRFRFYPHFQDAETYKVGIWASKGDSIKLTFKDDRIELFEQALIWSSQKTDQAGVSVRLRWRYAHMPSPENQFTYRGIQDAKITIYGDGKNFVANTNANGILQNTEISRIDSLRLENIGFSGSLLVKNPSPGSDSITLDVDAPKLWKLHGGLGSGGDGSTWIEGWWRVKTGQLYKKDFNLITVYELIE